MPGVKVKEYEKFETALRRFSKKVEESGILKDLREFEAYEKPTTKRKRKKAAAKKRHQKAVRSQQLPEKKY